VLFIPAALYGGTFALVGLSWLLGQGPVRRQPQP
jgi:hypothetical protein